MRPLSFGRLLLMCAVAALPLSAATYHVDPRAGSMSRDGSAEQPWSTLEAVMAAKKIFHAGDELVLRDGYHGRPVVTGLITGGVVTIRADQGQHPQLATLDFKSASNWVVEGLTITPEGAPATKRRMPALVSVARDCRDITIRECTLSSVKSVAEWTEADWLEKAVTGITSSAPRSTISGNRLRNVRFGITLDRDARDSLVARNTIENFMSDGLRGLADACVFEGNVVKNCYKIDGNHDDGFQSWSGSGQGRRVGGSVVKGVVLRGNSFISYTDPQQPFKAAMQGIGCFDGMFEDWVVENNLVVTDMWHGIAFSGATNCRIVNNTVVKNPIDAAPRTPWVHVSPHKKGEKSTGNVVRNNLVSSLHLSEGIGEVDHNLVVKDATAYFIDFAGFDFHLKPASEAIDAGETAAAPKHDIAGKQRTERPDVGAYEAVK